MRRLAAILIWLALVHSAHAQSVRQSGNVTPTHFAIWTTGGVIQDGGVAAAPFASTGGVQPGPWCVNSGPNTGAYQSFCMNANATTGGILSIQNFGGAPAGGISFNINGVAAGLATVNLPTVNGDFACFNSVSGSIIDCGTAPTGVVYGTSPSVVGNLAAWNNTSGTLLSTPSTVTGTYGWTGSQYFGSGRPWVDARSTANGTCAAALGNGSDDQPALQCQVNYLNSTFSGGILYLSGNFTVFSTLVVPNGVHLVCQGWTSSGIFAKAGSDITVLSFGASGAVTAGVHGCTISGYQNSAATQNMITIGTNSLVDFNDDLLAGGKWAVQNGGNDGHWLNVQILGWGTTGGGIISTGANWYDHAKIDQGSVSTLAAFEQTTCAGVQENHFLNSDLSGTYTDSVLINDGSGTCAYTFFVNSVFSAPIIVTSAAATTVISGEIGANITANSGTVIISSSVGIGAITVIGSAPNIICGLNNSITCPTNFSPTGGSNTQVQYNNAGALGGISGATSNGTSLTLASGDLILSGASSGSSTLNAPATGGGTATLFAGTDTIAGVSVAHGGTNCGSASITCFNNITGLSAAGTTGTTSTNLVFSTSPTLVTPTLGVASATSLTVANIYGGAGAGSVLNLQSTSSGAPSGDSVTITVGGTIRQTLLSNGSVGLGTETNPQTDLVISSNVTTGIARVNTGLIFDINGADSSAAGFEIKSFGSTGTVVAYRANGTAASKTQVIATNPLLSFFAGGYDSSNAYSGTQAGFRITAGSNNWTSTDHGAKIDIFTTPNASTTQTDAFTFWGSGGFSAGTTNVSTDNGNNTITTTTYYSGATAGVSCGAGTLNTTTAVVTGGIITHC